MDKPLLHKKITCLDHLRNNTINGPITILCSLLFKPSKRRKYLRPYKNYYNLIRLVIYKLS